MAAFTIEIKNMAEIPERIGPAQSGDCSKLVGVINQIIDYLYLHQDDTLDQEVDPWPEHVESHAEYEKMQVYVMKARHLLQRALDAEAPHKWAALVDEIQQFLTSEEWT